MIIWSFRRRRAQTVALTTAAKLARAQGKLRTADWLLACADHVRRGVYPWPAAPAYKGKVVRVEDSANTDPDLSELSNGQLTWLLERGHQEMAERMGW